MPQLWAPKESVLPQLRGTERKLEKNPEQATAYQAEITKLVEAGYIVKQDPDKADKSDEAWYIPHHMVRHNGKNRVVFNCSFPYKGHILNELLLPGPTLGPSLLAVLLRLREHSTAISSDIRGMFHQVRLLPEDRCLLRFLWRDLKRDAHPSVYEWQVLLFGTTCSPCCATFALQKHVFDHSKPGEDVRDSIERSFYVDNCLQSLPSSDMAKDLVDKLCNLLAAGGFELRQWASNNPGVISHLPSHIRSDSSELWLNYGKQDAQESTLGLHWNCHSDTLSYKHRPVDNETTTLRNIYKVLASQYDLLGYIIPYTTRAKILVQRLWDKRRDWDDTHLPQDALSTWHAWESELKDLSRITLPRCYTTPELGHPSSMRDIHIFYDASEQAYGAVAYLRSENTQGKVEIAFLTARSRVAPKKQQSVPRLELCAALTGAQLAKVVRTELTLPIRSVVLWTDSTTVLTWLLSESCRFNVFVGTRVVEIQDLTGSDTWRYVPSSLNPADDITRGKSLSNLTLREYLEAIAQQIHGVTEPSDSPTASEYADAELKAIRQAQMDSFLSEVTNLKAGKPVPSNSRLLCLAPEFDRTTQLVRVGGRLRRSGLLEQDVIHPIVLDPQHPLTKLIIKDYDDKLHHPGPERVFAEARRKYWVLQGREAVHRHQRKCTDGRKWRGCPNPPRMADLPPARLRIYKPAFYSTGVDCFGPFVIKVGHRNEKRWGILFKCMTSRAVYIDLLARLYLDSFLMALRRFMARRGRPHEILCDQGTNFRGGEKDLQESFAVLHPDLQAQLASQQIKVKFNPPNAPHFGGGWEREIRSPFESHIADPDPITPNSLLMGQRDVSLPQVVYHNSELLSRRRWRHSQVLADHFWRHFIKYYLPSLQARQKWQNEKEGIRIGETIMIIDPQLPRALWPVGRVINSCPGADNRIRSGEIQVENSTYFSFFTRHFYYIIDISTFLIRGWNIKHNKPAG
ncbi:hypothetical protein NFI96_008893, partial [Prochilodus magdalenae]